LNIVGISFAIVGLIVVTIFLTIYIIDIINSGAYSEQNNLFGMVILGCFMILVGGILNNIK